MGVVTHSRTKEVIRSAAFIATSMDEASQHGVAYLSITGYVITPGWKRVPLFIEAS